MFVNPEECVGPNKEEQMLRQRFQLIGMGCAVECGCWRFASSNNYWTVNELTDPFTCFWFLLFGFGLFVPMILHFLSFLRDYVKTFTPSLSFLFHFLIQ